MESKLLLEKSNASSGMKRRTRIFLGIFIFLFGIGLIIGVSILVLHYSNRSILTKYNIISNQIDRPKWWQDALSEAKVSGQDGASSNFLPNGNALWIFGDTVLNCTECGWGWKMITNSALILTIVNGTVIEAHYPRDDEGYARQIVPYESSETPNAYGIWPGAGILVDDRVYMYWDVINRGQGEWGFSHYAYGKGVLVGDNLATYNFSRLFEDDTQSPVGVGHTLLSKDGKYVYEYVLKGEPWRDVTLSRTDASQMNSSSESYTFWNGKYDSDPFSDDQSPSYNDTKAMIKGFAAQVSVEYNEYLQQYVVLSSGDPIQMFTAKDPWGPWSNPVDVFDVPEDLRSGLAYCAYFHPELWRENGRVMVFTYCVSGVGDGLPYMVEVELNPK